MDAHGQKRKGDDAIEGESKQKRSRWASSSKPEAAPPAAAKPAAAAPAAVPAKPPAPAAPAKPVVNLEALEKAKRALELQKQLQAKLGKIPGMKPPPGAAAAAPAAAPEPAAPPPPSADSAAFFDPRMGDRGARKLERKSRATFDFVEQGKMRLQAEYERVRREAGEEAAKEHMKELKKAEKDRQREEERAAEKERRDAERKAAKEEALAALAAREEEKDKVDPRAPVPSVEWWDLRVLAGEGYEEAEETRAGNGAGAGPTFRVRPDRITLYIEHPVPIEPPAEAPAPPPQPLKLTKKEIKKLRTQRRMQREKERQELIRQGLLEPPKAKVKVSNLMRVLGAESAADPTAIEQEVRKQMLEREQAHEDRNLSRKLTPLEVKEKKERKLFNEEGLETHVAVYRVAPKLAHPQNRYKVDVNATENRLTGVCLISESMAVVVVEGCPKSQNRYHKLLTRRINWNLVKVENEDMVDESAGNTCVLVWQGTVRAPAFERFRTTKDITEVEAKKVLEQHGVPHYWDLAKNFDAAAGLGI